MRARRTLSMITSAVLVAALVPAAGNASGASHHVAKATLKDFFKQTSQSFTSPAGKPTSKPAKGDILFATEKMYKGTKAHHASKWSGTAFLYCKVKSVSGHSSIKALCDGVIAIGGSMLISQSIQNLASGSKTTVYPIVAGTGKYLGARGSVKVTSVNKSGSNSNAVINIK